MFEYIKKPVGYTRMFSSMKICYMHFIIILNNFIENKSSNLDKLNTKNFTNTNIKNIDNDGFSTIL